VDRMKKGVGGDDVWGDWVSLIFFLFVVCLFWEQNESNARCCTTCKANRMREKRRRFVEIAFLFWGQMREYLLSAGEKNWMERRMGKRWEKRGGMGTISISLKYQERILCCSRMSLSFHSPNAQRKKKVLNSRSGLKKNKELRCLSLENVRNGIGKNWMEDNEVVHKHVDIGLVYSFYPPSIFYQS